jgi:hypothetical protein
LEAVPGVGGALREVAFVFAAFAPSLDVRQPGASLRTRANGEGCNGLPRLALATEFLEAAAA